MLLKFYLFWKMNLMTSSLLASFKWLNRVKTFHFFVANYLTSFALFGTSRFEDKFTFHQILLHNETTTTTEVFIQLSVDVPHFRKTENWARYPIRQQIWSISMAACKLYMMNNKLIKEEASNTKTLNTVAQLKFIFVKQRHQGWIS